MGCVYPPLRTFVMRFVGLDPAACTFWTNWHGKLLGRKFWRFHGGKRQAPTTRSKEKDDFAHCGREMTSTPKQRRSFQPVDARRLQNGSQLFRAGAAAAARQCAPESRFALLPRARDRLAG